MAIAVTRRRFELLVSDALDLLPAQLTAAMDNVVVLVADRNESQPELLGLYEGIALTERGSDYGGVMPDTITIYRLALAEVVDSEAELAEEVAVTVVHEIAHHFGIDEATLHTLGWG